ncbi:hypothetical protein, partial [Roseomonas rosulenta]|uniref:hypothetical protein n=1 Tax=Roseomonas rosulenta TaxID=2748667 RepID=UPI0018DF33F8
MPTPAPVAPDIAACLAAARTANEARAALRGAIDAAVRDGALAALHAGSVDALRRGSAGRWTPFALPAAAVALLRDPAHWDGAGAAQSATPALLAALDGLIAQTRGLPADRQVYLGVLEGIRLYVGGEERAAFARLAEVGQGPTPMPWFAPFDFASPACYLRALPEALPAGAPAPR